MEWTSKEKALLRDAYQKYGPSWGRISLEVGTRSPNACRRKWSRISPEVDYDVLFDNLASPNVDIDQWLDHLEHTQSLIFDAKPQLLVADVHVRTHGRPIAMGFIGCAHLGGLYTNYSAFRERFNQILEIDRFFVGSHGDDIENFPADWAMTVFQNIVSPDVQFQIFERIVDKLAQKKKLLYAVWSNHLSFTQKKTGEDYAASIYYRHGVPYFNSRGILKLYVDDVRYVGSIAHSLPGRSRTNPNHSQGREYREFPFASFVASAHTHQSSVQEIQAESLAYDAGFLPASSVKLIQIGSAKSGDPYSLSMGYAGGWNFNTWPIFVLSARRHAMHRVYDIEALKWYLNRKDF